MLAMFWQADSRPPEYGYSDPSACDPGQSWSRVTVASSRGAGQRGQQGGEDSGARRDGERGDGRGEQGGEDQCQAQGALPEGACEGGARVGPAFTPQPQPVEGPGGGPAHERPEDQPVGDSTAAAPARAVVIAGQEADPNGAGDIAPVAAALGEQRERVTRGEAQRRDARAVGPLPLARADSGAGNPQEGQQSGRVAKALRLSLGQVGDRGEPQVPGLVQRAPRYDVGNAVKRPETFKAIGGPGRSWWIKNKLRLSPGRGVPAGVRRGGALPWGSRFCGAGVLPQSCRRHPWGWRSRSAARRRVRPLRRRRQ